MDKNANQPVKLTKKERKLIDYALCFLNANFDEDNEESLEMDNDTVSTMALTIQKKLGRE